MPRKAGRPSRQYLEDTKRMQEKRNLKEVGMLTGGQAKIAAKAPPPNKIDEKDFAVLRAEKAKGRGMGLQDESKKPGKIYKAKRGMSFSDKMKAVEDGKINKKTGKPTSMAAMREMKGFKPGESASEFNKRRMKLAGAKKALSATRIGKIVLPIAAAGVAAQQYLKSKMKKDKKMGGGMMQKPMGYKSGMGPAGAAGPSAGRPGGRRPMQQGPKGGIGSLPKKRSDDLVVIFSTKDGTKQIKRSDLDNMSAPRKKMGGGMIGPSQTPGYSKGTMVKARGCKLGRTRPTKIT